MGRLLIAGLLMAGLPAHGLAQQPSSDVTQWRGPARDGVVTGFAAPAAWPEALAQKWKIEVGTGYATPLVVGNRVYQFSRIGDNETMTAIDAGYPATFDMNPATKAHGPSQTAFETLKRYKVAATETWAQPALSGNRIVVKDVTSLTLWTLN